MPGILGKQELSTSYRVPWRRPLGLVLPPLSGCRRVRSGRRGLHEQNNNQHQHLQSSHLRGYPDAAYHARGFLSEVNPTRCHLRPGLSRPSPRCFILPQACHGHFEVPRLTPVPISSISPVLYSSLEDAEQSEGLEDVYITSLSMETLFPLKSLSLGQDFAFSASSVPSHGDSVI